MANANELVPILHPLLIDVVVDKLFDHLNLKDIIIHRRVCTLWQYFGLKRLKSNIDQIKITFDREKSIEKFLEMANCFSFKFTNFGLRYYDDDGSTDTNPTTIKNVQQTIRLFNEYGNHIKVISLNLCGSTNSWTFLSDVLVNKAPNVECLCLERYKRRLETPEILSRKRRTELKLKHLNLIWRDANVSLAGADGIIAVLQILVDKGNISNLKELSLNVVTDDIFEILATSFKSAPLESFCIQMYQTDLPMLAHIETFFVDHKDSLKTLNIYCPCVRIRNKLTFPTMKNLEVLYMYGWWCHDGTYLHEHRVPFEVFDFGKLFPNLITLCIRESARSQRFRFFNLDEMFPEDTTPLLTLKNLELPPISNPEMLRRIGRIFPNVLKLDLVPRTPDVLRELWTTWPEIKTLRISILPYPSFRRINLDSIFTRVVGGDHTRNVPSISHLRKLKHLRIDGYPLNSADVKDLKIKDESVYVALAEMKELVSLEISDFVIMYPAFAQGVVHAEMKTVAQDRTLHLVKYEWQKGFRIPYFFDHE